MKTRLTRTIAISLLFSLLLPLTGCVTLGTTGSSQYARVACKNTISGFVTIRKGNCMYGEDMVKIMEPLPDQQPISVGVNVKVACKNTISNFVTIRTGSCLLGEDMVSIIGE